MLLPKFGYNITREYPYKWFTPVAIIGGTLLTVLFSVINFYSTAYNMVSITTGDPHAVEAKRWTSSFARAFTSKIQPVCEDAILPVGSTFSTNQSIFNYQLLSAQTSYHNEVILGCSASEVILDFSTAYDRPTDQINASAWGLGVTVTMDCYTEHLSGTGLTLQTQFNPLERSGAYDSGRGTYDVQYVLNPGLRWAQILMLAFWEETVTAITNQTLDTTEPSDSYPLSNLTSGYVSLKTLHIDVTHPQEDYKIIMKNENFFSEASWVFLDVPNHKRYVGSVNTSQDTLVQSITWPCIWSPVDRLAKAVLSTVYADLGQLGLPVPSSPGETTYWWSSTPNGTMISSADTLRYWTTNITTIFNQSSVKLSPVFGESYQLIVSDYDTIQENANKSLHNSSQVWDETSPPGWGQLQAPDTITYTPAVIVTSYICRQPQLKSPMNIFISILVADLVFLRAAWSLYNLIIGYFLKSRRPDANTCEDCLARRKATEEQDETATRTAAADSPLLRDDLVKSNGIDERTIELDEFGLGDPPARHEDQHSGQSLLTHRHV